MSKLDELIQQYCPDGVEFKRLSEIFNTRNGYTPSKNKKEYWERGDNPWFVMEDIRKNGNILSDSIQHVSDEAIKGSLFPENSLIVATSATIGEHALITVPSLANQRFTYLMLKDEYKELFDIKFLYYYCYELDKWCFEHLNQGNFASVDMKQFAKFEFPLPALPVQCEIVRILDSFTLYSAELAAELAARREQYEYYRTSLMTFDDSVQWKRLDEVCELVTGATPNTKKPEYWENGTIPWMSSGEVSKKHVYETEAKISELGYKNASTTIVPEHSVVIALAGQGKTRGKVALTEIPLCTNQSLCSMICGEHILPEYLYFYLDGKYDELRAISNGDGTRGGLSLRILNPYTVPVPSIQIQERIIEVLKRFDTLNDDISTGLPAEIEARQKQYEYYRDKLLTFKRKEA